MSTAAHCAVKLLLNYNITSLPIPDFMISQSIAERGFTVVPYSYPLSESETEDFCSLGLLSVAQNYSAFTYVSGDAKFVFYRTTLSAQERRLLLAHELGHIILKHFGLQGVKCSSDFKSHSPQEQEADDFAAELLAPTCVLKKQKLTPTQISHLTLLSVDVAEHVYFKIASHATNSVDEDLLCSRFAGVHSRRRPLFWFAVAIAFIATVVVVILSLRHIDAPTPMPTPYVPAETLQPTAQAQPTPSPMSDEIVVVTRTGDKYHRPDCRHVAGRNVTEKTIAEAIEEGYEACDTCRP